MKFKKYSKAIWCGASLCMLIATHVSAQMQDTLAMHENKGLLWSNLFGDYTYKFKADTVANGRGGSNQYSKVPADSKFFQLRRFYLGYDYTFNAKYSAEFILAAEDYYYPGSLGNQSSTGDVLGDNKFAPYLKIADIKLKQVLKGTDMVLGVQATPTFALGSEQVWAYRSIERTITDIRRTPSSDLGVSLIGKYGTTTKFGYHLMMGNGTGAKAANSNYPCFYANVWTKLFQDKLYVEFYQDYKRLDWDNYSNEDSTAYHHDRRMSKLFVSWSEEKFTVGAELFYNVLMGDLQAYEVSTGSTISHYLSTKAFGASFFVRGRIIKNKLGYFARYDSYNPGLNLSAAYNDNRISFYSVLPNSYDPTTKEQFITFGLDYAISRNIHIMPNIWMNTYECNLPKDKLYLNDKASATKGTDAAFRFTLYYLLGKEDKLRF